MKKFLKSLFAEKNKPKTEFSTFFTEASSREKKQVLTEVVRKANQDQKDLIERYHQLKTKTT